MRMNRDGLLIIGLGISGLSAALLAKRSGRDVFVTEMERNARNEARFLRLESEKIEYEVGNSERFFDRCSLAVISPGIDPESRFIRSVESRMDVVSEIEFAYSCMKAPHIIGVTGTNGKSTTVSLIHRILAGQGLDSALAGNIGRGLSDEADIPRDIHVCELSSYQLEKIRDFHPVCAVVTNLTPDHLNRYGGSFERYADAKMNIFKNMSGGDVAVLNRDDAVLMERASAIDCSIAEFSRRTTVSNGYYSDGIGIFRAENGNAERIFDVRSLGLVGGHNLENVLAALCAVDRHVASRDALLQTLAAFTGIEHRLEYVTEYRGISAYNDSKGTNVDSTRQALASFPGKSIVLILGGDDAKKNDFSPLMELISDNCRAVVLIGETSERLKTQLDALGVRNIISTDMDAAVADAFGFARRDDVILLSPAAASFDMFDNFEHRGRVFKEAVMRLSGGGS